MVIGINFFGIICYGVWVIFVIIVLLWGLVWVSVYSRFGLWVDVDLEVFYIDRKIVR